jgi:hypothetical protein
MGCTSCPLGSRFVKARRIGLDRCVHNAALLGRVEGSGRANRTIHTDAQGQTRCDARTEARGRVSGRWYMAITGKKINDFKDNWRREWDSHLAQRTYPKTR